MSTRKSGQRHTLLIYKRTMNRLLGPSLVLGLLLAGIWGWSWYYWTPVLPYGNDMWLILGAAVALGFSVFAFFARRVAYVQPRKDHLRVVTPFLRLNISYRRINSVHPTDFSQIVPPGEASWAQRRLFEPFYGMTTVVVELNGYPLPPFVLRFFLPAQMFSRGKPGLVLLVPDWMTFSTELDTLRSVNMGTRGRRRPLPGSMR
jgi:hypothetical protein